MGAYKSRVQPVKACACLFSQVSSSMAKKSAVNKASVPLATSHPVARWFPLFIFVFAGALYLNTLGNGFVMDDGAMITDNKTVQKGIAGIRELFQQSSVYGSTGDNYGTYRPLTMTLFAVEWQLFGDKPFGYHLVHIVLYGLCCAMVFITLSNLLKDFHPGLPALTAMLFAAHPVHTEVGANIKSGDEIMSLLLCMAALYFSLRAAAATRFFFTVLAWLCFFAALFSKESAITFIVIIPMALLLFTKSRWKQIAVVTSGNLAAVVIFFVVRNVVLDEMRLPMPVIDNILVSATSSAEKSGTIFYFLFYYIRLLVFPHPLTWDYGYNHVPLTSISNPLALSSLLFHAALGIYAAIIFLKTVRKRASQHAALNTQHLHAFAILFYLVTLSVYTHIFVQLASNMAERFLFTPSLAFCLLLALLLLKITRFGKAASAGSRILLAALTGAVLVPYAIKTFLRNKDWKSNLTLFEAGVKTSPHSYRANSAFAWENLIAGEKEDDPRKKARYFNAGKTYYQKAISIFNKKPDDWYNLGVAHGYLKNQDEAIITYRQAVQMNNHPKAAFNLGSIYLQRNEYATALKYFLIAYQRDASVADVGFKVGLCYHYLNEPAKAIPYYEKYHDQNPSSRDVVNNLMLAYRAVGNTEKEALFREKLARLR